MLVGTQTLPGTWGLILFQSLIGIHVSWNADKLERLIKKYRFNP